MWFTCFCSLVEASVLGDGGVRIFFSRVSLVKEGRPYTVPVSFFVLTRDFSSRFDSVPVKYSMGVDVVVSLLRAYIYIYASGALVLRGSILLLLSEQAKPSSRFWTAWLLTHVTGPLSKATRGPND